MDKGILLGQLPVERRILVLIPPAVKPDGSHLAVVGEQLCQLIVHKLIVALPVAVGIGTSCSSARTAPRSILTPPVDVRVIEMDADALLVALVSKLLNDVALERCGVHDVIIRILGMEHREALVVSGGEADILRS